MYNIVPTKIQAVPRDYESKKLYIYNMLVTYCSFTIRHHTCFEYYY